MAEKSGALKIAAIRGVRRSLVKAETTVAKAAPTTTPTAMSITFPRRINCLNPLSISTSADLWRPTLRRRYYRRQGWQIQDWRNRRQYGSASDPHGHHDVAVLIFIALGGTHLAGRLRILELELYITAAGGLQKIK